MEGIDESCSYNREEFMLVNKNNEKLINVSTGCFFFLKLQKKILRLLLMILYASLMKSLMLQVRVCNGGK